MEVTSNFDMDQLQREVFENALDKIANRCKYDLYYLAKYILDYELMEEEVHGDLCRYTAPLLPDHPATEYVKFPEATGSTLGDNDQFIQGFNNLLLLMPRGTFKSSVVTIGFGLQNVLIDPDIRILIDSETHGKAKAFMMEIRGHLENNFKFREVFRHIHGCYPDDSKRSELWSDSQLVLACRKRYRKEPTFQASGIDSTKNGMHYDLILCDDLHSEKNVTTKEQIDQVIDHWKLAYSLLDPNKPMIVIGTRWDYNDLYQHILDNERDRFNILIRSAYKADGSLLFPSRLDEPFLEKTKRTQGSYIFSCQYLNQPVDNESATFKRSHMITMKWELVKDIPINWYLMVDPSYDSGEYSDFAALVIAGMDYDRNLYVRHVLRAKMTYSDIITNMFDLYGTYHPTRILLETIGTKTLEYELKNEQKRRGSWLPVTEIRGRKNSKEDRIRALAPFYEFGHMFHVAECAQLDDLEYELLHFPRGKHDDIIDALASVLEIASPARPSGKGSDTRRRKRKMLYKPISPIAGY